MLYLSWTLPVALAGKNAIANKSLKGAVPHRLGGDMAPTCMRRGLIAVGLQRTDGGVSCLRG